MAELLGIVAGGAGLVSLALQLVDGGQKLRNRYKNAKGLEGNVLWLGQDLELIGQQLIQLESSAYIILQEQLGPIMLERCRSRSAYVAARLDSLTQAMPVTISKRELIQATLRSGQWKSELKELQCLVTGLKQDISHLMKTFGRLATANSDSRDLVVSLVSMGCDFRDTVPTAETWDLAPVAFIHSDYDAFLQALLKRNPDFADSPPLHYSVLHDSDKAFEILAKQISTFGASSVRQPLRVLSLLNAGHEIDPRDKGGITPLVYAAALDVHDSILILVGRGASLVTGNLGLTVAHYLGGRSD
ncbi:hypothetical protein HYE68_007861 [Fusarium pseudograminearum]|nr:hypothetical protein HYE68_007861 [Fusarium pseudograminearum]